MNIDDLFNILDEEKSSEKLTKLNTSFIDEIYDIMKELQNQIVNSKDLNFIKEKIQELDKIKKLFLEIMELRKEKIFNYVSMNEFDIENLLDFEEELVISIKKALRNYEILINNILENKKDSDFIKIELLEDIPRFLASNGKEYGPFSKGDYVELPKRESELLIKRGLAKEIINE